MKFLWLGGSLIMVLLAGCGGGEKPTTTPIATLSETGIAVVFATPAPTATPAPSPLIATALTDIRVRIGPEDDSFVIGVLPSGTKVEAVGQEGTVSLNGSVVEWLALPGLGWVRYDPARMSLNGPRSRDSFVFSRFRTPLSPSHPVGFRTGHLRYDRIIELMEAGDGAGLRELIRGVTFPCYATPPSGAGPAPPCGPGMPANTGIEGIVVGACEGAFLPREDAFRTLIPSRFFAAVPYDANWDYLVFTNANGEMTIGVQRDGRIRSTRGDACGSFMSVVQSYLVPPPKPAQLR